MRELVRLLSRVPSAVKRTPWGAVFVAGVPLAIALFTLPVLLGALPGGPGGSSYGYGYGGGPPADSDLGLIGVPANITVNAVNPSGAVVSYTTPTAVDEDGTAPPVACDYASGSTFPIGRTTVTCTTTDADDSPSQATASFSVTVEGASQQLHDFKSFLTSVGAGRGLVDLVQLSIDAYDHGRVRVACTSLVAAIGVARAESGHQLTVAEANQAVTSAQRIRSVISC